jgi:hypothetical protein
MSYAELQDCIGELVHGEGWPTIRILKIVAKAGAWAQEKLLGEETFISYSVRSAISGSTFVARRAGSQHAIIEMPISSSAIMLNVKWSIALTP